MSALLDALGYLGQTLDKPGASVRGLLAGRPGQLANLVPFSDTFGLTDPSQRTSGRDLLEAYGVVGPNEDGLDLGDVAGFGAELATDPLNWLGAAGLARTGMAAKSAKANNLLRDALLAKGGMPEEIAGLTKAVDEAGNPIRTYHGTPHVFDTYDMAKMNPGSLYGPGIYTTESPGIASEYATKGSTAKFGLRPGQEESLAEAIRSNPKSSKYVQETYRLSPELTNEEVASVANRIADDGHLNSPMMTHLLNFYETVRSPENVRMQYMDLRSPFDIDKRYKVKDLPPPLRERRMAMTEDTLSRLRSQQDALQESLASQIFSGSGDDADRIVSQLDANSGLIDSVDRSRRMALRDRVTGQQLFDDYMRFDPELLGRAGYDSLTHVGGNRMGNVSHRVWIATDPSQIYAPFLAPAQKDVPSMSPLLAALGGYQAGVLPGRLGGAR